MTTPENTLRVGIPERGPSFREALANRDFTLFFVGQLGSEIGNGLVQLAIPILVLQLTGSAFQLGLAYFFQFLPMLLFGLVGGVFVDRWDRRLTIVVVDGIRAVAYLSVGFIYYVQRDALTVEHLYAVMFLESTLANFFNPARAALIPNLISKESRSAANSLIEVSRNIGFLIAPPVGAVLVAWLGPAALMLSDGATFFLSGLTVFLIHWRPPPREVMPVENPLHAARIVLAQTKEGLTVIARSRILQVSVLLGCSLNLIVAPIQVLMPLFVFNVKHADAKYLGLLVAGLLVGLLVGSLTAPATTRRHGLGPVAIFFVFVLGVVICVASWLPTLWPPVIAMAIAGTAIGTLNVAQTTMLQNSTTDDERGRVSATYYTATLGVRPFGYLMIGALASSVADIRFLFVALGIMALALGVLLYRLPEVREHR